VDLPLAYFVPPIMVETPGQLPLNLDFETARSASVLFCILHRHLRFLASWLDLPQSGEQCSLHCACIAPVDCIV
jgi:hypothetical protein